MPKIIDLERLIHSTKTAIACIFGFLLAKLIGLTADQWVVITIIVVMCAQIYVGSVLQKAYLRFLGTIFGCIFAIITIETVGDNAIAIAATIAFSAFIFSYLAMINESYTYAASLGAVTTAIIMLGQKPSITFAAERFFEISVGIMIAMLVSQFILPIHARTHLRRAQADTLQQLRDYFILITTAPSDEQNPIDFADSDEAIAKLLIKQRQLAKESTREPLGDFFDPNIFMHFLLCERGILRAISFMQHAYHQLQTHNSTIYQQVEFKNINEKIVAVFSALSTIVATGKSADKPIDVPDIAEIKHNLNNYPETHSAETQLQIDGLIFSLEILLENLRKLVSLYKVESI